MNKLNNKSLDNVYDKVSELLRQARNNVAKAINHTMVITYYEIGKMIVEEEQEGKERLDMGNN